MPSYEFINPDTLEMIEVSQRMSEPHVYIDENGLEWKRVWSSPNAAIDTDLNPEDRQGFLRKTESKNITMGDMMDQSAEMSRKRAKLHGGEDPVQRKYLDDWSKKRKGKKHPKDPKGGGKMY